MRNLIFKVELVFLFLLVTVTGRTLGQVCSSCGSSTGNDAPSLGNLAASKILQDTFVSGDYVFSVFCKQNAGTTPVEFCITSSASSYFSISKDGLVKSVGALAAGIYQVDIKCCDDVGYKVSTLTVDVRPAPSFTNLPTTIHIPETTAVQASFFQVQATNNGYSGTTWTYSFDKVSNLLQINKLTGAIILIHPVDYEEYNKFVQPITLTDSNGFTRTSTLTINVDDFCAPPVLLNTPYSVNIREDATGSAIFFTASAYIEQMDTPTYSITSMTPSNTIFTVSNANTGTFQYTSATFDENTVPQYMINIQLADACGSATAAIAVNILEVNPPVFTTPAAGTASVSIVEQQAVGTAVPVPFIASCDDTPNTNALQYSIACCTPYSTYFKIDTSVNPHQLVIANKIYYSTLYDIMKTIPIVFTLKIDALLPKGLMLKATLPITITLTEIPIAPVFSPSTGSAWVEEQQPIGTVVNQFFSATDANIDNKLNYALVSNTYSSLFNLVTTPSCHLTTNTKFLYSSMSVTSFTFLITATDSSSLTATYTLTVSVVQINNVPVFSPQSATVTIDENLPIGTSVPWTFNATCANVGDTLTYSMVTSTFSNYFVLNTIPNAYLTTNYVFRYYTMPQTSYTIAVRATNKGHLFDTFYLTVKILPIKWTPVFNPSSDSASVQEKLPPLTDVENYFPAIDPNPAETFSYTLLAPPEFVGAFSIVSTPKPHLVTQVSFDYYTLPYTVVPLKIQVVDGDNLSATYSLTVTITSVNSSPGFNPSSATVNINELEPIGYWVPYNFSATKQNPTDILSYSLVSTAYSNYFTLVPTPVPHLVTNVVFDYNTMSPSSHTIETTIKCTSSNGLTSVFTLTISVLDVIQPPVFSPSVCQTNLDEKKPIGTTVNCFFSATDPNGALVTYKLEPSTYSSYFTYSSSPLPHLETAVSFVYNTMPITALPLTINATNTYGLWATYSITVQVDAVNTAPVFATNVGTGSVTEGQPIGTAVPTYFSATDAQGDLISYKLRPAPGSTYFTIQLSPSPHLETTQVLNLDTLPASTFLFDIWAMDVAGLYTVYQLTVTVNDAQYSPVCTPASCQTTVDENVPIGTPATPCIFSATDPDGDPLTYTIGASLYSSYFSISSGVKPQLITAVTFDYYTMAVTTFTYLITAEDPSGNTCTFSATIGIKPVAHAPVFTPSSCTASINANQPVGLSVPCNFLATDVNTGDSITYSLVSAQYSNYFGIQLSPQPHLVTQAVIDYPSLYPTTSFTFTITARDNSGLTATFSETINLVQVNLAPTFNPSSCAATVAEYQPVGTTVNCFFSASDRNIGDTLTYSMPPSSYFTLVTTPSPHLETLQVFNYYTLTQTSFTIVITATDAAGATATFTEKIDITYVLIAPYFVPSSSVTVPFGDGQPIGTVIPVNMTAYWGKMDAVAYRLLPSQYSSYFTLTNTVPPQLKSAIVFDYYQMGSPSVSIQIQVKSTKTGQSGTLTVTVDVYVVNTPPVFNVTKGSVNFDEQQPANIWLPFGFKAKDREDATLTYILSTNQSGLFQLKTVSGLTRLYSASVIDYDSPTLVNPVTLYITAVDSGGLNATIPVTVTIRPVYKFPPQFNPATCNKTISALTDVDSLLFTFGFTDSNVHMSTPTVDYTLGVGSALSPYFRVGEDSGRVTVYSDLPNTENTYILNATVINDIKPSLYSSMTCYIITTKYVPPTTPPPPPLTSNFTVVFFNFEIRSDAKVDDYAALVKPKRSGTSTLPIIYSITESNAVASMEQTSGAVVVSSKMAKSSEYIYHVTCDDTGTDNGPLACAIFRLDTYDAANCLTNFVLSKATAEFTPKVLTDFMSELTTAMQTELSDAYPRLVYINDQRVYLDGTVAVPSSLPNQQNTNITVVVLKGTYTDNQKNITNAKQYYYATNIMPTLLDVSGEPGSALKAMTKKGYPVSQVIPYIYQVASPAPVNWWLETTEGIITICGLSALVLGGIIAAIAVPAALAAKKSAVGKAVEASKIGRPSHNYGEFDNEKPPLDDKPTHDYNKPNSAPPDKNEWPSSRAGTREASRAASRTPSRQSMMTDVDTEGSRPNSVNADNVSLYLRDSNSRFGPSSRYVNLFH